MLAIVPIGIFIIGSLGAIPADGTHSSLLAASTRSSSTPTGAAGRPYAVNTQFYPDNVIVDDWLCDGMAPRIELSARERIRAIVPAVNVFAF